MDLSRVTVLVVGGGIGGFAAAAALARLGARVTLREEAAAFQEVGAGLQISANGQCVLRALGMTQDRAPDGATVSLGTVMQTPSGRRICHVPPPVAGATWYMHRADLLDLLISCATAAGVKIEPGQNVRPSDALPFDLIVAADGAQSAWRAHLDGDIAPRFSNQVAWRALVPVEGENPGSLAHLTMGSGAHIVTYPLRNGSLMNIVAVEERDDWQYEGWRQPGDPAELRRRFAQFDGATGGLLERAEDVHLWALHLRPVARRWTKGNVALLGDAAHPTLPFMAQGACLALEDAWTLAKLLSIAPDVKTGLSRYQALRIDRARNVVALARGNARRFHLGLPWAWGAQAVLALGSGILARRLEWLYAYDVTGSDIQLDPDRDVV